MKPDMLIELWTLLQIVTYIMKIFRENEKKEIIYKKTKKCNYLPSYGCLVVVTESGSNA